MEPYMVSRVTILGVSIDAITRADALSTLLAYAKGESARHVVTPNPEMLVAATRDEAFRSVLNKASLALPDGAGLLLAAAWNGDLIPERVSGVDVLADLCALADVPPIFLLGAASGVAERAAEALKKKNPALVIAGTYAGSPSERDEQVIIAKINASGAKILFVAYGAPAQDMWISRVLLKLTSVRLAMGVGGAFDFLAGVRIRAPLLMRALGLEWFWRFLQEPSRYRRIARAVIVFPWLVVTREDVRNG